MEILVVQMDFRGLVEQAKAVEKAAGEKKPVLCEVSIPKTIDFSPEEFLDKDYQDLLNEYKRMVKIAKASGMAFQQVSARIEKMEEKPSAAIKQYEEKALQLKPVAEPKAAPPKQALSPVVVQPKPVQPAIVQPKKEAPLEVKKETVSPAAQPKPGAVKKPAFEFVPQKKEAKEEKPAEIPKPKEPAAVQKPKLEIEKPAEKPAKKAEELEFEFEAPAKKEEQKPKETALEFEFETEPKPAVEAPKPEAKKISAAEELREAIGEVSEIPYLQKHEPISLAVPPLLSLSPESVSEKKFSEIEARVPKTIETGGDSEIKKRMVELTKEMFKEKGEAKKEEIKKELGKLREMLSKAEPKPGRAVSYATSMLHLIEAEQAVEIREAKENLMNTYRGQLSKTLESFSSSIKLAKSEKDKKAVYDTFAADLDNLSAQLAGISHRYESFFLKEHRLSLEKLNAIATVKSDKYVMDKIAEKTKEMEFTYASEFLAFENAVKKELSTLSKAKMHEALGETDAELSKVLSIASMKDEELMKYVHAKHPAKYAEFESGKITKLELAAAARALLAAEEGIKKDVINKYFG